MLRTLAILLGFQCLGEVTSFALRLPVPGPVIGMLALIIYLALVPSAAAQMRDDVLALLGHLSLLFVPAGVGVMLHARRLADEGVAIVIALLVSTALAIVVTALVVDRMRRWIDGDRPDGPEASGEKP
ncbi:MAG: CidA/LrgA family protein [Quisquiliibacterium sp.]